MSHLSHPIATMNHTMALARARLTMVRTSSEPFMAYLTNRLLAYQAPAVMATRVTTNQTMALAGRRADRELLLPPPHLIQPHRVLETPQGTSPRSENRKPLP
jgi:hypothetical protein